MNKRLILLGIIVFMLIPFSLATIQPNNLEVYYSFDSTPNDSTPNSRDLSLNGTPSYNTSNKILGTASGTGFSLSNNYFYRADEDWQDVLFYNGNGIGGTLSFWVYDEDGTTWGGISQKRGTGSEGTNNLAFIHDTGQVLCHGESQDGSTNYEACSSQVINADTWYHVVFVFYTNDTLAMFVDGSHIYDYVYSGSSHSTTPDSLIIGNSVGGQPLVGSIDEFAVWNTTLTASEISELYNSGNGCDYDCIVTSNNIITINVNDLYDSNNIQSANVTIYNSTWSLINTTDASGDAYFYNISGSYEYNVTHSNYFDTNSSINAINGTTNEINITGAWIGYTLYDLENNSISSFNITDGTQTNSTTTGFLKLLMKPGSTKNVTLTGTGYQPVVQEITVGSKDTTNYGVYQAYNAEMKWIGSISGNTYIPECTLNGTSLTYNSNNQYALQQGTYNLSCVESDAYEEFQQDVVINNTFFNETFSLTEYTLTLSFSGNVTGVVSWLYPNGTGDAIDEISTDSGYNVSTFDFIKIKDTWPEDTELMVYFNQQGPSDNASGQYYEYILEDNTYTSEDIYVLDKLDYVLWTKAINLGNEELFGATIRVMYYNSTNGGELITQRITRIQSGDASTGTPIYIDKDLIYWITVSKEGYQTKTLMVRGIDYNADNPLVFSLERVPKSYQSDYYITGPTVHHNETTLVYFINYYEGGTIKYSTSINTNKVPTTLLTGGAMITLLKGTHYSDNSNFTLNIYTYNSTTNTDDLKESLIIVYEAEDIKNVFEGFESTKITNGFLWAALIAIASIVGAILKNQEDVGAGYIVFSIGSVLALAISGGATVFVWVASINILTLVFSNIKSVTRD